MQQTILVRDYECLGVAVSCKIDLAICFVLLNLHFSNFALDSYFLAYSFEPYLQAQNLGGHREFLHIRFFFSIILLCKISFTTTIELLVLLPFSKLKRKN